MDDTEKHQGTVQYWLEVHSLGSLLFENIKTGDNSLKSLIKSIIESPLLPDIECLTANQIKDDKIVAPFTAWLLQGLLKAATLHSSDDFRTLYIEAQTKLLLSTYDGNVFAFRKLITLYIEALENVLKTTDSNLNCKFLLPKDFTVANYDRQLTSISFQINNKKDQIDLAMILIEVISTVKEYILYHCVEIHQLLWNIVAAIMKSEEHNLKFTILPLLQDMLNFLEVPDNSEVLKWIVFSLPAMLSDARLGENEIYQKSFTEAWNCIKTKEVSASAVDVIINEICKVNESNAFIKNFILNEMSFLLAQTCDFELVVNYLTKLQKVPLEKTSFLLDTVVCELEKHVTNNEQLKSRIHSHHETNETLIVIVSECSETWKWIISSYCSMFEESDPVGSRYRLESVHNIAKITGRILGKVDKSLKLSKLNIRLNFFENNFIKICEKILMDLNGITCQYDHALKLSVEAFSELFNLSEVKNLPPSKCKEFVNFLISPFQKDKFQLPVTDESLINQSSNIPSSYLKALQCIPPGTSPENCIPIFSKCASNQYSNDLLSIQAVKSVPFLFSTKKTSPSRLISDILFPAALSKSRAVHMALFDGIADLVCALAGTGFVTRDENGEIVIKCCECSSSCKPDNTYGDVKLVEAHLLKLISQVGMANLEVKRKLLQVLPRLTMHTTGLRNEKMLESFLRLLEDEDEKSRFSLANCITSIIFGRSWVLQALTDPINEDEVLCFKTGEKDGNADSILFALNLTFKKLEEKIHVSLRSKNHEFMQLSLLETLTNIACFPINRVLGKSIQLLFLFIGHLNAPIASIFLDIAAAHKTTPLVLYYCFRPEICQLIGSLAVVNRLDYNQPLRSTLSEVFNIFKGLNEKRFVTGSENYLIPIFTVWISKYNELQDIIVEWSNFTGHPIPIVVSRSFQYIYTHIFLTQSTAVFNKCMSFIERITNLKVSELILHSQKMIINQLLFNYHKSSPKVLIGLKNAMGSSIQGESREKIADSLESRFVGYLLFIVSKFVKEVNADSEKVTAIQSLTSVIELMGKKHVTPVARKVVATLQTILTFNQREYFDIQCKSWEVFITTVDANELGPLLATIVVSLLPFTDHLPKEIARIFSYMIIKNEKAVEKFLPCLIFIPDHPALVQVNQTLRKYLNFEGELLKDRLTRETSLALHETVGVRVKGLKALQTTIRNCTSDIQNLIVGSDEPDPCIKTLLESLILCCGDSDQNIAELAASCLGQLGAVDPGLLPREPKPKTNLPLSVHDPEFAFLALSEMARGFQNARNSVDMDAFAIAIQELLKVYQIAPNTENEIWNRFQEPIRALMTPMLSSRYKVQAPKRSTWPDVIFGSKEADTHVAWASIWASKLIGFCRDDRAVFLFSVCEPSLKRDTKVLQFFLQYILLHAVIRDSSVHDLIVREIETVINWSSHNIERDDVRNHSRPIRLVDYCGYPNMRSTITTSDAQSCAMTIFLLLDFLHSWLRVYRATNFTTNGEHLQKKDFILVKDFLDKIDYVKVSTANYEIREYSRAIMYLEDVISKDNDRLSEHLPVLSKAYALYGDLDSVAGASTFQKTAPKMEDLLLSHQVSGQIEEVRIIYERLGKDGLITPAHMQEMVQCYLNLGEPFTAYNCIQSFTTQQSDLKSILSEGMTESLLKLGDYTQLSKHLDKEENARQSDWFVQLGRIVLNLHLDKDEVLSGLSNARIVVANAIKQTGLHLGNFQQGYSCLVKWSQLEPSFPMHFKWGTFQEGCNLDHPKFQERSRITFVLIRLQILNEMERIYETINLSKGTDDTLPLIENLLEEWNLRSGIVQSNPNCLEPLMSMRRILLDVLKQKLPNTNTSFLNNEIGKYWVKSAEIARKAGCFHQAYNYILNAEQYNIPSTFIEKAQLFWDKGDQDLCLFTLSRGIKEYFPDAENMKDSPAGERLEERKMCAEARLLYAIYNEETSNCDHNTNMSNYQRAYDVCRQLEKTEAFLAQCMDRVISQLDENELDQNRICELKVLMVHHFGKSLMHGCEYIYQTVPRMLSIWLDMGDKVDSQEKINATTKINKLIRNFTDTLPPFILMTALPQLLSRLGHPNNKVFQLLKYILISLLKAFPQQCLWAAQVVAKSSVPERVQRFKEFIQDSSLRSSGLFKLISDFTNLCDKLNKLTNRNIPQDTAFRGLKVSSAVRELPPLLASEKFSPIIIPITRFCSISLPRNVASSSHECFPKQAVYITGIEDEMTVLHSLQRPRKISFRGSDGKLYDILCKPKDDLRRDSRLMEFNNIVNMYLHRDPESRARRLHIRTYVVTPLGEVGGLLEWVPNLIGLRQAIIKLYKQFGKYVKTSETKKFECQLRDTLDRKRQLFVNHLLVLHPPLFPEWFRLTFPDPSGWYIARQSYTRTTAVMSMVGYILGLGDRHGENILFDSESGDTVHVDFNCLFNKGEKFDWKERVPFRLTHNMVAAMGPLGVEGTFRKSCEISLRVLRSQSKTLMSVLTPFAYDPFGSWGKNKEIVQNERDQKIGEAFNELSDIEKRLNGSLRVKQKNSTLYLSVEGQARSLIVEATDVDNLCQMYFGWGAYL